MNNFKRKPFFHSGVAMVEFAIVLPLLILILFGTTEIGRALYQQNALYKAVSTGSRYLARVGDALTFNDEGECTTTGDWPDDVSLDAARSLIVYGNTSEVGTPLLPNLDADGAVKITVRPQPLTKTDNSEAVVCVISVHAEANFAGVFGEIIIPFTSIKTFKISAETEERYIGQ